MQGTKDISRGQPEFSVLNEKNDLKKVEDNVHTMKNRVELLRQQLQKQKDNIKKNKSLTKQVIQKKIEVNRINQYKQKDNSEQENRIEQLRRYNQNARLSHRKELQEIQKAIYLVKLDDAREAKNISLRHRERLQEMNREFLSAQKQKKTKVAEESAKAKERYMKYWKQKLGNIYMQQAQSIEKMATEKERKKEELKDLQEEEIKLMEEINKFHTQQVQSKKQYLAALSLPVKEVAEAMGESMLQKSPMQSRRRSQNYSSLDVSNESRAVDRYSNQFRLPNASVNQNKLKVILKQLKKMDRNKSTFSAREY